MYNRNNCQNRIRRIAVNASGTQIYVTGKHAFEWFVHVEDRDHTKRTTYPYESSRPALACFSMLCKAYNAKPQVDK